MQKLTEIEDTHSKHEDLHIISGLSANVLRSKNCNTEIKTKCIKDLDIENGLIEIESGENLTTICLESMYYRFSNQKL